MNDYVDRTKLLHDIETSIICSGRKDNAIAELRGVNKVIDRIKHASAEDVAPIIHAKWIDSGYCEPALCGVNHFFRCSNCDMETANGDNYEYCPHCGAIMDGNRDY